MLQHICQYDYIVEITHFRKTCRGTKFESQTLARKVTPRVLDVRRKKIDSRDIVIRRSEKPSYCVSAATPDVEDTQRATLRPQFRASASKQKYFLCVAKDIFWRQVFKKFFNR